MVSLLNRAKTTSLAWLETFLDILKGSFLTMTRLEELVEPEALMTALWAGRAKSWWDAAAPSYRQYILRWIAKARREATREKRINTVVDHCIRGEEIPHY